MRTLKIFTIKTLGYAFNVLYNTKLITLFKIFIVLLLLTHKNEAPVATLYSYLYRLHLGINSIIRKWREKQNLHKIIKLAICKRLSNDPFFHYNYFYLKVFLADS